MAEAAFNLTDWILLADVGEHMRQKNDGDRGLARGDVQAALEAGCGLMLRWVGDDGREVCREEFFKRDSWEDILVWAGLPQRLCVQLPPDERKGNLPYARGMFAHIAKPFIIPPTNEHLEELRLVFDTEGDGLLETITKFHYLVISAVDSDRVYE
jgi:hypothetical protein